MWYDDRVWSYHLRFYRIFNDAENWINFILELTKCHVIQKESHIKGLTTIVISSCSRGAVEFDPSVGRFAWRVAKCHVRVLESVCLAVTLGLRTEALDGFSPTKHSFVPFSFLLMGRWWPVTKGWTARWDRGEDFCLVLRKKKTWVIRCMIGMLFAAPTGCYYIISNGNFSVIV